MYSKNCVTKYRGEAVESDNVASKQNEIAKAQKYAHTIRL